MVICTEVVINIVGDYLTVVYNWPIKGLGVRGIAGSAVAGASVGRQLPVNPFVRFPFRHLSLQWRIRQPFSLQLGVRVDVQV